MAETKTLKVSQLSLNTGQVEGLPQNPRFIRDERYEALKKSIADAPEMLELRELLVYPYDGQYVVIGGNMRLRACKDLGHKEIPCKILPEDTPVEKLREYTIKDNQGFGQDDYDLLANEWNVEELNDWGMNLMDTNWEQLDRMEQEDDEEDKGSKLVVEIDSSYSPDDVQEIKQKVKDAIVEYDNCHVK